MNTNEKMLLEAVQTMLQQEAGLGLSYHKDSYDNESSAQYIHEQLNDAFALKIADLDHYDGVRAMFRKVHNYMYTTDVRFCKKMTENMRSIGIPADEISKACLAVESVNKEILGDKEERDFGWNLTETSEAD